MKKIFLFTLLIGGIIFSGYAQNVSPKKFRYRYEMVRIDSTLDKKVDPSLAKYVDKQKSLLDQKMNVVIGKSAVTMVPKVPQSLLSNYLTDLLLKNAPAYAKKGQVDHCDLCILNLGGMRTQLSAGNITVGNIYAISPFDNYIVFVDIKGSELKKCFQRFHPVTGKAVYSGAQVTFKNDKPVEVLVQGEPIQDEKVYKVVTLNFISEGGDKIMSGLQFEDVLFLPVIFRDFILTEIKKTTEPITAVEDDRAIVR